MPFWGRVELERKCEQLGVYLKRPNYLKRLFCLEEMAVPLGCEFKFSHPEGWSYLISVKENKEATFPLHN